MKNRIKTVINFCIICSIFLFNTSAVFSQDMAVPDDMISKIVENVVQSMAPEGKNKKTEDTVEKTSADEKSDESDSGDRTDKLANVKDEKELEPAIFQVIPTDKKDKYTIELRNVKLGDFFRVIAHDYGINILVDKDVEGKVVASFTEISLDEAIDEIATMYDLKLEKKGEITVVKPNIITDMVILKYINAAKLLGVEDQKAEGDTKSEEKSAVVSNIYDLLSENGRIFIGHQNNSLVIIDFASNVRKVKDFILAIDKKVSMKMFKLKYLSVKDLFPGLAADERAIRDAQRKERDNERNELKNIKASDSGSK